MKCNVYGLWLYFILYLFNIICAANLTAYLSNFKLKGSGRIIGGRMTDIAKFPSTACLIIKHRWGNEFRGGATIISLHWVITAAHCMVLLNETRIRNKNVFVHSNSKFWGKDHTIHLITKAYVHKKYNNELTDFDIALARVKEPFNGKFEKPIRIAPSNYKYVDNSISTVVGWGTTESTSEPFVVDVLRYVNIKIVNFKTCQKRYQQKNITVTDRMICALSPGKDACINDSGGPLYQNKYIIGIVSWGGPICADKALPGVYTKISLFHNWIRKKKRITNREPYCKNA